MIPSAFVPLETFPLLPNGKIDRRALPPPRMVPDPSTMASVSPRDPLEFQLHQIWKRTLDAPSFGIHDDFFDLGGDSLKAADVIRAIGQTFPTDLPITALNTAPTIAELAATLRAANAEAAPLPSLHTLKPGRGAHTLFLSHNVLGGTSLYAPLARRIPDEIAVVGVEPLTSGTTLVRRTRLTEMAADFVAQIQRVQPEGPYHVGGLCAGGMIAFEAALQLEADGHDVALVALIDTVNPREWARRDTLSERLRRFKRTLRAAGGSGPLRPLRQARAIARSIRKFARHEPPRRLRQLVKRLRCNQLRAAVDRGSSTPAFAQNLTGPELYAFAEQTYSPTRPLHAPAILFRATAEPDAAGQRFDNPTLGWHHWTGGGLTVVDIPAGHITMLREPHVATLANHLADRIEDPAQPSTTPRLAVPTL